MQVTIVSTQKGIFFLAIVSFLFLSTFGLSSLAMPMSPDGHMSGCPFMGMTAVCQMSPFEHISAWQNMFTATATEDALTLLFLFIFAALVIGHSFSRRLQPEVRVPLRYQPPDFSFFRSPLQEAFSNGILNPKVF